MASVLASGWDCSLFSSHLILWITIGILHLILVRLLPSASWLGALQVSCDVGMITAIVYATGLQDSNFTSLYLLVIIVASILFSRQVAFLTSLFCLSSLALTTALVYSGKIPRTSVATPTFENIRLWFLSNSFGFLAVAYLASLLAVSLRKKSSELEQKREELLELQDFTADIIHSMRGGLVTTDLEGRVVLLNRTGEEILGRSFTELRGHDLREVDSRNSGSRICLHSRKGSPSAVKSRCESLAGSAAFWASPFRRFARAMLPAAGTSSIFRI